MCRVSSGLNTAVHKVSNVKDIGTEPIRKSVSASYSDLDYELNIRGSGFDSQPAKRLFSSQRPQNFLTLPSGSSFHENKAVRP